MKRQGQLPQFLLPTALLLIAPINAFARGGYGSGDTANFMFGLFAVMLLFAGISAIPATTRLTIAAWLLLICAAIGLSFELLGFLAR